MDEGTKNKLPEGTIPAKLGRSYQAKIPVWQTILAYIYLHCKSLNINKIITNAETIGFNRVLYLSSGILFIFRWLMQITLCVLPAHNWSINSNTTTMKKVTGIGGIFFKCKDPKQTREWYKTNLGLNTSDYGASFEWYHDAEGSKKGLTQWSAFDENTKYFAPSTKDYMINYIVEDLEALVEELKQNGVTIVDDIQSYDYGKFVHILDPDGNNIELWEPAES